MERDLVTRTFLFFFFLFLILFEAACSNEISQKINNLTDINGDYKSDLIFWNKNAENPFFETLTIQNTNYQITNLGNIGDIPVYGDFTGDGNTDYGVYQQSEGINKWYLIDGFSMTTFAEREGLLGDLPVPNDFDGDGKCDLVVYRPSNSGFYGLLSNKGKVLEMHFGVTGDIPIPKDYDGDGKADLATYRPASGAWLIRSSKNGLTKEIFLGGLNYFPIPADYNGDNKADLAVWNKKNNECKIIFSSFFGSKLSPQVSLQIQEKLNGSKVFPVSSDFDGDKKSELAFWESDKNLVHIFKVNNNLKYEQFHVGTKKNSKPIYYFLLNRFLNKNNIITSKLLFKKYKDTLKKNLGEKLTGDFDGDGRYDTGTVDVKNKTFTYLSSALNKSISIGLSDKVNGKPFPMDVDLDLMTDLVFYNPDTNIFGVIQSSNAYGYDEVLLTKWLLPSNVNKSNLTNLQRKVLSNLFGKTGETEREAIQKHFAKPDKRRMSKEGGR